MFPDRLETERKGGAETLDDDNKEAQEKLLLMPLEWKRTELRSTRCTIVSK